MATHVGQAIVKVTPNAEEFHADLQRKVEQLDKERKPKINIKIESDITEVLEDLRDVSQAAEALEKKNPITLRVILQDAGVKEGLVTIDQMSKDKTQTVTSEVILDEKSIRQAEREMSNFRESNSMTETWLTLETSGAEKSFDEFRERMEKDFQLTPKITVPASSPGSRKSNPVVAQEEWNAVNWLPKLYDKMHSQMEAGVRQVYDPYIKRLAQFYNLTASPFREFRKVANEATNLNQLFDKLSDRVISFGGDSKDSLSGVTSALKQVNRAAEGSAKKLKSVWSEGKPNIKAPPGLVRSFDDIRLRGIYASESIGKGFSRLGRVFDGTRLRGMAMADSLKGGAETAAIAGMLASDKVGRASKKTFSGITSMMKEVAWSAGALLPAKTADKMFSPIDKGSKKTFGKLSQSFRDMTDMMQIRMEYAGKAVSGKFIKPLGRGITKGTKGVGKLFTAGMLKAFNSKILYSAIRGVTTRIANLLMGGMRMAIGSFAMLGGAIMKSLLPALGAAAAGIGLLFGQVAIAGVLALSGAVYSVAQGAALMAPALVAAAGISFLALKIGLEDVKTAVGQAFSAETTAEFEEAIKDMPGSVQAVARAFRGFKPAIDEMKSGVQDNLLAGLAPGIESTMNNLLPTFSSGLQGVASEWNSALKLVTAELSLEQSQTGLANIMKGTQDMAREMQPTLANLVGAFMSLADQGSKFLAPMGKWINDASASFLDWSKNLASVDPATGMSKFDSIIMDAQRNATHLGGILSGVFGTLSNILTASQQSGDGMLAGMAEGALKLKEYTSEGSEGFEKIVQFMTASAALAPLLGDLLKPVLDIVLDVGTILANVGTGALPGITSLAEGIASGMAPLTDVAEGFGTNLGLGLESLSGFGSKIGVILAPLAEGLGSGLRDTLLGLGAGLDVISEPMQRAAEALGPIIANVGTHLGEIFTAAGPLIAGTFDMITAMSPILDKVISYLAQIAVAVMEAVAPIFLENDNFLKSLAENMTSVVDIIGGTLLDVIAFLAPLIPPLVAFFYSVLEFLTPFLPMIASAATFLTLFGVGIATVLKVLGPFIKIIKGVRIAWTLLSAAFTLSPIGLLIVGFAAIGAALYAFFTKTETGRQMWENLTNFMTSAWDSVKEKFGQGVDAVKGFFSDLGQGLKNTYNDIKDGVFNAFINTVEGVRDRFRTVVDIIGSIWEGLKEALSSPIKFMVQTVYNEGIRGVWNKVADAVGLEDMMLPEAQLPPGLKFARGGVLPGYTPGRDVHEFASPTAGRLLLSGGEAIMRPEWTRAVGGPRAVEEMNRAARFGKMSPARASGHAHANGGVTAFANGGVIGAMIDIVSRKYPGLTMTSGLRPGDSGYHGSGLATDWSNGSGNTPAQLALAQDIASTYPGSAQLIYSSPGFMGNIGNGSNVGDGMGFYGAGTMAGHQNHVHWAMDQAPTMPFGGGVFEGGYSGGSGGGFFDAVGAAVSKVTGLLGDAWDGIKSGFTENLGGAGNFGKMMIGAAGQMKDMAWEWIKEQATSKASGILDFFGISSGNADSVDVSGISGPIVDQVQEVFARHGFTGAEWDAAKWIIQKESNWDPNATNPSSGAFGLFQFNPMGGDTLGQYLPSRSSDPAIQADAGARYMRNRYGSPTAAKAWWEQNEWYDQGGEASGIGVMQKNVLTPERVLSPTQTAAFNDFVYRFMPELITQWKNNPRTLKDGFTVITGELKRIQQALAEAREVNIGKMSGRVKSMFEAQINGTKVLSDVNLEALKSLGTMSPADMESWIKANGDTLSRNITGALNSTFEVSLDPAAYLEAEKRAKEAIDKEAEEAKTKADEEAQAAKDAAKEETDKARQEREQAEDEAAKTEEEKAALQKAREAEREDAQKSEEKLSEETRAREEAEQKRIDELKATGEYYYGYKVLGDDGSNPNSRELTREEEVMRSALSGIGEKVGLGGFTDSLLSKVGMVESIGQSVQTALPSWMAAAQGDYAGLNHNAAVAANIAITEATSESLNLIPAALTDLTDVIRAMGTPIPAMHIEQLYTGMSRSEFDRAIDERMAQAARRGSGTTRPR